MACLLTEARGNVITFARYTAQIFQVLDLTLFGVLKSCPRDELLFESHNPTVKFIIKVYHDFKHTKVPPNGWRAFHALEFDFEMRREPRRCLFDEEKLRGSAGFRERRSLDFPWTSRRAGDALLGSVRSTGRSKVA
jgi:hypothetical protein